MNNVVALKTTTADEEFETACGELEHMIAEWVAYSCVEPQQETRIEAIGDFLNSELHRLWSPIDEGFAVDKIVKLREQYLDDPGRERRSRKAAVKKGCRLKASRVRNLFDPTFGLYRIVDGDGQVVAFGDNPEGWIDLDAIEVWIEQSLDEGSAGDQQ